jgi:AAA+ ATPase superfamily predicted ATPase
MFIGRKNELADLAKEFAADRPSLIIMYGRRRIGKSTLIQEATKNLPSIYFQATKGLASDNLDLFKVAAIAAVGDDGVIGEMPNWFTMLNHLAGMAERRPGMVVTLDEFPFLCEADQAMPSIVQKFWDSKAPQRGNLKLILCGSIIAHMSELLAERNPLYGRHSAVFDIEPLPLRDAAAFFPSWSAEDIVTAYGILGGVPYYLETFDAAVSLERNIIDTLLARRGKLADEPSYLMASEMPGTPRFHSIMQAIADGCTKSAEIRQRVTGGVGDKDISWYLHRLIGLRIVRAEKSMDASPRERDRRYVLDDPLIAFWFRFVRPALSAIRLGRGEQVYRTRIMPSLADYMGDAFEEICRKHVRLYAEEFLPTAVAGGLGDDVGKIWADDYDIDVAARLLDGTAVFGECKWRNQSMGASVLTHLIDCASRTRFGAEANHRHFMLFSKSGFAAGLIKQATGDRQVHLLTPNILVRQPPDFVPPDVPALA